MVNWYRAIVRDRPTPATETVEVPTLVIWGARRTASFPRDWPARASTAALTADSSSRHGDPLGRPRGAARVAKAIADHADPLPRARGSSPPNDFYIDAGDDRV